IGEGVVEHKIPGDCEGGGDRLCQAEAQIGQDMERREKYGHVDADTGQSDHAEQQKAERHRIVGELGDQKRDEVECYAAVELALSMQSLAKNEWQLGHSQPATRGGDDVEQDLEPLRGQRRRKVFDHRTADHEEAAHGVGELYFQETPRYFTRPTANAGTI